MKRKRNKKRDSNMEMKTSGNMKTKMNDLEWIPNQNQIIYTY